MWIGLADVFAHEYGNSWAWYSAGTTLILLGEHKHWMTDLVFGGLIGLSISKSVRTLYSDENIKSDRNKLRITPHLSQQVVGITFSKLID